MSNGDLELLLSGEDTISLSSAEVSPQDITDSVDTILQPDSTPEPYPVDLDSVLGLLKDHFGTTPSIPDATEAWDLWGFGRAWLGRLVRYGLGGLAGL